MLRQLAGMGQLSRQTRVWSDGMQDWVAAGQIPGLLPATPVGATQYPDSATAGSGADKLPDSLCRTAMASRTWATFIAIAALVHAGLLVLGGLWWFIQSNGIPLVVAVGVYFIIGAVVSAVGGILLLGYASALGQLTHGKVARVMETAMDKLRVFWTYAGIVLIVQLAFAIFFAIWVAAVVGTVNKFGSLP
jgi:hypothetical protein